jgi:hypothetical protein
MTTESVPAADVTQKTPPLGSGPLSQHDGVSLIAALAKAVGGLMREQLKIFEARLTQLETSSKVQRAVRDGKGRIEKLVGGTTDAQQLRDRVASLEAQFAALTKRVEVDENVGRNLAKRVEVAENVGRNLGWKGVWREGQIYRLGNFTTHHGAMWHCESDMPMSQPGKDTCWRLAVKRGQMSER